MVLDFLVSPTQATKEPWSLILATFVFVSFGVFVEMYLPIQGSIIVFAMVPLIPLVWMVLMREEELEESEVDAWKKGTGKLRLFSHNIDLWEVFAFFFIGSALAYTFWFAILPPDSFEFMGRQLPGSNALFADQLKEVSFIRGSVSAIQGQVVNIGLGAKEGTFWFLLEHNLQVMGLMLLFSLVYGIGSIYLLLWNASIIGVVIGGQVHQMGIMGAAIGFLNLLPHGIFEMSAYFLASIAGGLFSMEFMKRGFSKPDLFFHVFLEVLLLLVLSFVLLGVGAYIEASY
ncbi:stage II sporulation protein M [Candidatus Micrarchaeota archaeon]|nr:stage II sporulation protein M [Candidatus Micrarchaeota archaeon]